MFFQASVIKYRLRGAHPPSDLVQAMSVIISTQAVYLQPMGIKIRQQHKFVGYIDIGIESCTEFIAAFKVVQTVFSDITQHEVKCTHTSTAGDIGRGIVRRSPS